MCNIEEREIFICILPQAAFVQGSTAHRQRSPQLVAMFTALEVQCPVKDIMHRFWSAPRSECTMWGGFTPWSIWICLYRKQIKAHGQPQWCVWSWLFNHFTLTMQSAKNKVGLLDWTGSNRFWIEGAEWVAIGLHRTKGSFFLLDIWSLILTHCKFLILGGPQLTPRSPETCKCSRKGCWNQPRNVPRCCYLPSDG
jgi:hypothetical protein